MSSRGANVCTCSMNYTTMNGSRITTGEDCVCGENYHIPVGSDQCMQCPANSLRAVTSQSSMCTCESNHSTGSGSTTTSGSVACDGELTYRYLLKSINKDYKYRMAMPKNKICRDKMITCFLFLCKCN